MPSHNGNGNCGEYEWEREPSIPLVMEPMRAVSIRDLTTRQPIPHYQNNSRRPLITHHHAVRLYARLLTYEALRKLSIDSQVITEIVEVGIKCKHTDYRISSALLGSVGMTLVWVSKCAMVITFDDRIQLFIRPNYFQLQVVGARD